MPASTRCSNRRFTTSPGPRPSLAASSPTVNGPGSSISGVTTGGAATGVGGGGGGRLRSLILGTRSFGGAATGAGNGAAPGSTGARGGWGRGASRRGGEGLTIGRPGAAVPADAPGRMGRKSLVITLGGAPGCAGRVVGRPSASVGPATAGRVGTATSAAAGFALTAGSPEGFAGISLAGSSDTGAAASGSWAGTGSRGGGGGVILRMPRMRSPLAVLATRDGSGLG